MRKEEGRREGAGRQQGSNHIRNLIVLRNENPTNQIRRCHGQRFMQFLCLPEAPRQVALEIGGNYSSPVISFDSLHGFNSRIAQCSFRSKFSCLSVSRLFKWSKCRVEMKENIDFQRPETSLKEEYGSPTRSVCI